MTTLDLAEAAQLFKVHPKTLQRMARAGSVPACKVGRSWVFVERLLIRIGQPAARTVAEPVGRSAAELQLRKAPQRSVGLTTQRLSAAFEGSLNVDDRWIV